MATEERLRDELNRAADPVRTDTPSALARVVTTARRRQRRRRLALVAASVALVVVGAFGAARVDLVNLSQPPPPADHPSGPNGLSEPTDIHAAARTALTGEWQTSSLPAARVREALAAAGVSPALTSHTLGDSRRWFVQMTFSQHEGNAALVVRTSDPTNPGSSLRTSDLYLYRLLPGHRLLVTSPDPGTRWVFSYRLDGDRLTVSFLRAVPAPPDDTTTARPLAWTYAPLTLVH